MPLQIDLIVQLRSALQSDSPLSDPVSSNVLKSRYQGVGKVLPAVGFGFFVTFYSKRLSLLQFYIEEIRQEKTAVVCFFQTPEACG